MNKQGLKKIVVVIETQTLFLFQGDQIIKQYAISSARNGVGETIHSEKTPRGWHQIRAKIGEGCKANTVFVNRRPTGEIFTPALKAAYPNRDWILTRILWLSGLERGKNRLGEVDTMRRFIYIHGSPDDRITGRPGSRGCICMRNHDIIDLYQRVEAGDTVYISESLDLPDPTTHGIKPL